MNRQHLISKSAILLARAIGGPERNEWVCAMAAEWDALDKGKARWALGCLGAALHDRIWRERALIAAVVAAAPLVIACNGLVMTLAAPALRSAQVSTPVWMAVHLLNPAVVPLLLGALVPRRAAAIGLATGLFFVLAPMLGMLLIAGISPLEWLRFAYARMGPAMLVYPMAVAAWTFAGRFGARLRRRFIRA